jgi:hypothetical protein
MPTTMAPIVMKQNTVSSAANASQLRASSALKKRPFQWITVTAMKT